MEQLQKQFENYLEQQTSKKTRLEESMGYSLRAGGKRFRPMLALCCGSDLGMLSEDILPIAYTLEMIHTYSLIHDDLPALDNDDFRRGKETNHRVFGEAVAILAGDALLTDAFLELMKTDVDAEKKVQMIECLVTRIGSSGMIQGQSDDLLFEKKGNTLEKNEAYTILQSIHANKTGKLIEASLLLPAIAASADEAVLTDIGQAGRLIGLWFQIRDDILDVSGTTETLGKDAGSDLENDKLTYVSLFGIEGAKSKLKVCEDQIHELFNGSLRQLVHTYAYVKKGMR